MREIQIMEKRQILLDILSAVTDFCRENKICYSMACGTMLGAVRHKGFIPWDDDIDIYIPRQDYCRLEELFPELLDGKYKFASYSRTKEWYNAYGKIYDDRTLSVNNKLKRSSFGINIDVYPIDDVPDDEKEWKTFRKKQKGAVLNLRYKILEFSLQNSARRNIELLRKKIPIILKSRKKLLDDLMTIAQSNNGKGYKSSFECCQGIVQQHKFPKSLFSEITLWPFEDRMYYGFKDADSYLKNGYGDYMKLPPKEKQVLVHGYDCYWKD